MDGSGQFYLPVSGDLAVAKQHMAEQRAVAREVGRAHRRHRPRHRRGHAPRRWLRMSHQRGEHRDDG